MQNEMMFKKILINYFSEERSLLDSSELIINLGTLLGDDVIYGTILHGSTYLVQKINTTTNKKYLGQIIIDQIDRILEMEYNLFYNKILVEYQDLIIYKLDNFKRLNKEEESLYKKSIEECSYILSSENEIFIDDLKCDAKNLSDYQKFEISKSINEGKNEYYMKKINSTYEMVENLMRKNLPGNYTLYK